MSTGSPTQSGPRCGAVSQPASLWRSAQLPVFDPRRWSCRSEDGVCGEGRTWIRPVDRHQFSSTQVSRAEQL